MVTTKEPTRRKDRGSRARNSPTAAADSAVSVAVKQYGPQMSRRGGAAGRAAKAIAKGTPPAAAAANAAKQGKGAIAETRLAADMSVRSGLHGERFFCRPNPCPNDPHVDLQLCTGLGKVEATVQVGTGRPSYVQRKQGSAANQVVVNTESLRLLRATDKTAAPRLTDRVQFQGISSAPLSDRKSEQETTTILVGLLDGSTQPPLRSQIMASLSAGAGCSVVGGIATLVFRAFGRLARGEPLDRSLLDEAFKEALCSFAQGTLQSFLMIRAFVSRASHAFDGCLLRWIGECSVWAGALADVIIHLVKDFLAWCRDEFDFDELLRRARVKLVEAVCAAGAASLALLAGVGLPALLLAALVFGAVWLGSVAGHALGEWLFPADARPAAAM